MHFNAVNKSRKRSDLVIYSHFNPLSPKSDRHQISPCDINALINIVVMRITDMITQNKFA